MATKKRTAKRTIVQPASMFVVPFDGYGHVLLVCIGASDAEVIEELNERNVTITADDHEQLTGANGHDECVTRKGCVLVLGNGQMLLRLRTWDGSPVAHDYLAHEIFHAIDKLFEKIGIGLCRESEEAYAYAIGSLTRNIMTELQLPPSKRGAGR